MQEESNASQLPSVTGSDLEALRKSLAKDSSNQFFSRLLQHLVGKMDLSGSMEFILKEIDRWRARRQTERIVHALIELKAEFDRLAQDGAFSRIEIPDSEALALIEKYLSRSAEEVVQEKRQFFTRACVNGLLDTSAPLDLKSYYFDLAGQLSFSQLRLLSLLLELQEAQTPPQYAAPREEQDEQPSSTPGLLARETGDSLDTTIFFLSDLYGRGLVERGLYLSGVAAIGEDGRVWLADAARPFIKYLQDAEPSKPDA